MSKTRKKFLKPNLRLVLPSNKVVPSKKVYDRNKDKYTWVEDGDMGSGWLCPTCDKITRGHQKGCSNPFCEENDFSKE